MKKKLLVLSFLAACTFQALPGFGQANSVQLKTGTTVVSSHPTIAAAYQAIPATITQPYLIELTATYTAASEVAPVTFTTRAGASATNTITLRPAAGVSGINISVPVSGSSLIILDDTDYMILDGRPGGVGTTNGITLGNTATATSSNTISLINGATRNVIRNINLVNGTTTNTGRNISLGVSASNPTGNSHNQFLNLVATGGRYNINSNGTAASPNTRNRFYGCDIVNGAFAGIWGQAGTGSMTIDSCRVFHTSPVGDGPFGIVFDAQRDSVVITRNKVYDLDNGTRTSSVRGISIRSTLSGGTVNYSRVANNFIALGGNTGSTSVVGLEYAGSNFVNAEVYFNSIRITGTLSSGGTSGNVGSAALSKTASNATSTFNLKNNLLVNERSGGNTGLQHVAMSLSSTAGIINSDYNTYNATSTNLVRAGATLYTTVAAYQAVAGATNEVNSNSTAVQFVSATDLHLTGASIGNPALTGQAIAGLTTDIDNQVRNTPPYRGADEAIAIAVPASISSNLNNRTGVRARVQQNFNVTINAGSSAGQLVKTRIALTNPAQAANITLSAEITPGVFQPITFDASGVALIGPPAGIPLANATAAFRAVFNAVGTYNYTLSLVDATTGATVGTAASESVVILVNGLQNELLARAIAVYPNPVAERLTVQVAGLEKAEVSVFDLLGKQLIAPRTLTAETELPVQDLATGTYLLQVKTTQDVATKQFVVVK